jgi:hypothetical protein
MLPPMIETSVAKLPKHLKVVSCTTNHGTPGIVEDGYSYLGVRADETQNIGRSTFLTMMGPC